MSFDSLKAFGCTFNKEFYYWSARSCGILCILIALRFGKKFRGSPYDLVNEGLRANGYVFSSYRGQKDVGWKHQVLSDLLNRYGLVSETKPCLPPDGVCSFLSSGYWLIASVKSKTGSHLILMDGIDVVSGDQRLRYCNPSAHLPGWHKKASIGLENFKKIYLGRSIIVKHQP